MSKPVLGIFLGGILGVFDGLTALLTPEVAPMIVGIVIGSTIKGIITGVLIGLFARKFHSLPIGIYLVLLLGCCWRFLLQQCLLKQESIITSRLCCLVEFWE